MRSRNGWTRTGLVAAWMALLVGCAVNPVTGKRELSLVSADQELRMGEQGDEAAVAEYGLYDDAGLAASVDRVGQKLAAISERPDLKWHFRVLDSPVINAFALPGGYIYVTRGILATLNSEAQLAGVLGHEIGHVTARHSARQATQQQLAGLGLGLGSVLIHGFDRYAGVASEGLGLLFLKFSRDDETQADELGVKYTTRARYDPREIPSTYGMLNRMRQREGGTLPTFLSTHPDPGDREARTRALADAAVGGTTGSLAVLRADYRKALDGVVYGEDPRQGYVESSRFFDPALKLQVDFPPGWKIQNARSAVTARAAQGEAGLQLTLVKWQGPDVGGYPASLRQQGRIAAASGGTSRVGGHEAWMGTVSAPDGKGGTQELLAAWVSWQSGSLLQWVGAPAAGGGVRASFTACVESVRDLRDPARLAVQPARLALRTPPGGLSLAAWLAQGTEGRLSVPASEIAWLNGLEESSVPPRGEPVKLPRFAP
ncbi:MAG: M48 family metalloprotease [Candidatus Eisenbacteria bacterium]|nr:M48 family metalloprotease [Candidatus Eisenbacteria bacterium]